jgi:hypothetical protein
MAEADRAVGTLKALANATSGSTEIPEPSAQ